MFRPLYSARRPATSRGNFVLLALALLVAPSVRAADESTPTATLPAPATHTVDFVKELQPLFAERCYDCHGNKKQESSFRADNREDLLKGGDHGPSLVISNSAQSILVQVLADVHPDIMGMPKKKEPFTEEQIGLVRAWIDQGAVWESGAVAKHTYNTNHWAFKTPVRPAIPAATDKQWVRTPIDNFIAAKLDTEKLKPSPEADKITLLRRLSIDLIGLPPSPQEVDAFLADTSPDAYAKQVERLLASPHYGEKWGRQWLDAARYADSDGFEKDKTRNVTFYRDWVINAFNHDLPYDEFITEQLAGDLLPNATQDQIVATGFLRNSMVNEEGGIDPEQFRMEAMFDRMDAIGKSMLGLTIQCAQCHNHKFDPILQEDYYKLFAFLNNDHEAERIVYTPSQQMQVANLTREISDLEEGLRHRTPDWEQRMALWEDSVKTNQPVWTVIRPIVEEITTGGQRYIMQPDGSFLAQGYAIGKSGPHFWLTNDLQNITAFRFEQFTDPNLPCNGPGRSLKGISALTEFTVDMTPVGTAAVPSQEQPAEPATKSTQQPKRANAIPSPGGEGQGEGEPPKNQLAARASGVRENASQNPSLTNATISLPPSLVASPSTNKTRLKFSGASADYGMEKSLLTPEHFDKALSNRVVGPVEFAIDNDESTAWGIDAGPGRRNTDHVAVFNCEKPAGFAGGTVWDFRIIQRHGGPVNDAHQNYNLGRFRISVTTNTGPVIADSVPKRVRDILALPRAKRSPKQIAAVFSYWRTLQPEFAEVNQKISNLQSQWPEGNTQLTLMARDEPRMTHLLKRGDFLKPANEVKAGVPGFLHPLPSNADGSRLTLAHWLTDKKSPTTARSLVNRVWQAYFGTGLLESPEDFGTRAETPSHPELLDWLACEFMEPTREPNRPNSASDGKQSPLSQRERAGVRENVPNQKTAKATETASTSLAWSIKHLHRLIANSATYRQSSHIAPELYARDPYNRLLARGPRFRVEGEIVRDIALATSGLLNPELGGRSIFPPAPEFLFAPPVSYGPKDWPVDNGPERYRRSLYIFRFRSVPYPLLQTFDAPNGDFSCVRRLRSNTPLQALVSLNEDTFMECAQALARKTLMEGGTTDTARIDFAFRRTLSRPPTESERTELLALLEKQKQHISEGWVNATELATGKSDSLTKLPANTTPTQLAAYTVVSRVLLNLDETITKE